MGAPGKQNTSHSPPKHYHGPLVIYAHPGSTPLYGKEIEKLQDCDIPLDNIIEIEELPSPNFGIDNNGYIGFI